MQWNIVMLCDHDVVDVLLRTLYEWWLFDKHTHTYTRTHTHTHLYYEYQLRRKSLCPGKTKKYLSVDAQFSPILQQLISQRNKRWTSNTIPRFLADLWRHKYMTVSKRSRQSCYAQIFTHLHNRKSWYKDKIFCYIDYDGFLQYCCWVFFLARAAYLLWFDQRDIILLKYNSISSCS